MTARDTPAYATDEPRSDAVDRTLTVSWRDPTLRRAEAQRRGGLEFLAAIRDGTLPPLQFRSS